MTDRSETDAIEALRRRVAELEAFVEQVRGAAAKALAALGIVATVLGLVLPMVDDSAAGSREESEYFAVVNIPFIFAREEVTGDNEVLKVLVVVGFVGLILVDLACLWVFGRVWARSGTDRAVRVARVFVTLTAIGSLVPIILALTALGTDGVSLAPGFVMFVLGVGLACAAVTRAGQGLWADKDGRER